MFDPQSAITCPVYVTHWWQHHLPVGTWVSLLAFLGVVVPWLFRPPEKMGRGEKAIWTALMFVLVGLELWGLHCDRVQHDQEQADAECKQLQQFSQIATTLGTAITTDQTQFQATMQRFSDDELSRQKQFDATMGQFSRNESANQNRYARLIDHEEQLAAGQTGILIPSNEPTPNIPCRSPIPSGAITAVLEQGELRGYAIFERLPHVIVGSRSHGPILSIDRTQDGNIYVILDLRSGDDKIIARVNKDGYVINRNNTLEIQKDAHHLNVVDLYGRDVLSLNYINPTTIVVRGPSIGLVPGIQNWCAFNSSGADISMN